MHKIQNFQYFFVIFVLLFFLSYQKTCNFSDNPESDILGANLFDRELLKNAESRKRIRKSLAQLTKNDSHLALMPSDGEDDVDIVTSATANPGTAGYIGFIFIKYKLSNKYVTILLKWADVLLCFA